MVRKSMMILLAGMLLAGLSSLAMAQEGGAKPEAAKAGKGHVSKIERALAGLTLSAEEKAKVDPVVAEYKKETESRVAQGHYNDEATAIISIAVTRRMVSAEYAEKIAPLLSEENKAKFEAGMKAEGYGKNKKAGEEKKEGGAAR